MYRDDLEAERARADALQRRLDDLELQHDAKQRERGRPSWVFVACALVFGIAGSAFALGIGLANFGSAHARASGTVVYEGSFGKWTLSPNACKPSLSGDSVALWTTTGASHELSFFRNVTSPDSVVVTSDSSHVSSFSASHCGVFDGDIKDDASRAGVRGDLKIDCSDGTEHVFGYVSFADCK